MCKLVCNLNRMKEINLLGLHKLLTLRVIDHAKLKNLTDFIIFTDNRLKFYELEKVGFSSYVFENNSFTVSYCLKESHICIHTWPEIEIVTLDVYICNYSQNNTEKVQNISADFINFFSATIRKEIEIER